MIGYRTIFCCLPLFLTLAIIVSSAPILDVQLLSTKLGEAWVNETLLTTTTTTVTESTTDDDDSSSSDDDTESTTVESFEETTIDGQLPANATDLPLDIDEILKLTERIFSINDDELPSTPTTENPEDDDDDDE
jgi:hypothetical protein